MNQITIVPVGELKPAEYNPRRWSVAQVEQMKESIKRFGMVDPIIANGAETRKNVVIGGHFRLMIAKELGHETVPVVYVDVPEIERERELNLRLNKNLGEWDYEILANHFDVSELLGVGFTEGELGLAVSGQDLSENKDPDVMDEGMDSYLNGSIRQIVLYFKEEEFNVILKRMEALMEKEKIESHTGVFTFLLDKYENN